MNNFLLQLLFTDNELMKFELVNSIHDHSGKLFFKKTQYIRY